MSNAEKTAAIRGRRRELDTIIDLADLAVARDWSATLASFAPSLVARRVASTPTSETVRTPESEGGRQELRDVLEMANAAIKSKVDARLDVFVVELRRRASRYL